MPSQISQLIFPIALVAAFWFLIIRPQQQRAKQQALMLSQLQPGAEVLTVGGIFATVIEVGEDRLRVAIADGSELEIVPRSVQTVVTPAAADETDEPDESDEPVVEESDAPVAAEGEGDA